jgi:hypothetical protein
LIGKITPYHRTCSIPKERVGGQLKWRSRPVTTSGSNHTGVKWDERWSDGTRMSQKEAYQALFDPSSLTDDEIPYLSQLVYRSESYLLYLIYKEAREVIG